jgi:hypothetical protein
MPKLQEKPSALKRKHPVLKNMKLWTSLFLWVIFALLDPDPQFECGSGSSKSIADPCGFGSSIFVNANSDRIRIQILSFYGQVEKINS